jgi:GAF domain-containing protein
VYKYILIVFITAIGIFIEFSTLGSVGSSLLEILLFMLFLYALFLIWRENSKYISTKKVDPKNNSNLSKSPTYKNPIFDVKPASLLGSIQSDNNLKQFIEDQFSIIWSFLLPHNGYLIIKTLDQNTTMVLKQLKADLVWEGDSHFPAALQLMDSNPGEILIENKLDPDSNVIPYYKNQDYKPKSLLGFKIVLKNLESIYFLFDAQHADYFNSEELGVIKKVIQTVILVVNAFLSDKGIQSQFISKDRKLNLSMKLNEADSLNNAIDIFTDFIVEEFEASKLTIGMRCSSEAESEQAEILKSIGLEDTFKKGYRFNLDDGLNGWVIQKNKSYLIDNIDKGDQFIPRFSINEKTNYGIKSFLSVPLRNNEESVGMVTLEHEIADKFNDTHKDLLKEFVNIFSAAMPRLK